MHTSLNDWADMLSETCSVYKALQEARRLYHTNGGTYGEISWQAACMTAKGLEADIDTDGAIHIQLGIIYWLALSSFSITVLYTNI